jgi:3'(2'), 5'-bisphosphate nucleotidase
MLMKCNKYDGAVNLISKEVLLKLCMVAEGQADCYPRLRPLWNVGYRSRTKAICEHAGFRCFRLGTKENMLYNREELLNNWF